MKAMKLTGIRQMELMEVPDPRIVHADDVVIKMQAVGVCGSDVHCYETGRIGIPFAETKAAFDLAAEYRDGVLKAMIEFD